MKISHEAFEEYAARIEQDDFEVCTCNPELPALPERQHSKMFRRKHASLAVSYNGQSSKLFKKKRMQFRNKTSKMC